MKISIQFLRKLSSKQHHDGVCIDAAQGIFIILISADITNGTPSPIHVQKKIVGHDQALLCENKTCEELQCVAGMSGYASFECSHLQSAAFIKSSAG